MTEFILGNWQIKLHVLYKKQNQFPAMRQDHSGRLCTLIEAANQKICDGVIISRQDPVVGVHTADCLPLVIATTQYAYALHLSRKTLLTSLVSETFEQLTHHAVTGIFIGPHICPRHLVYQYEGEEILAFKKAFPHAVEKRADGTALSLKAAIEGLLQPYLTPSTPIIVDSRCTYEDSNLPSYRRWLEGGKQGELQHLFTMVSAF